MWFIDLVLVAMVVVLGVLVLALRRAVGERQRSLVAERSASAERLAQVERERVRLAEEAVRAEDLERVAAERSALLRSVSHDLRTPLSAIRAVATDLRDGVVYDEATRADLLATVCDEVDRLDRLVANLLTMSRIEAGVFEPQRQAVDLHELVADRIKRLTPLLAHVKVKTGLPTDLPLIRGDYPQLEQVFTNLLANAARHAPGDSDIWVVARHRAHTDDGPMVQIEVSDQGAGIDPADRDWVFEPFRSGKGSASSGIGLAICRAIVEAHGGSIGVERSFGGGATFVFTVPVFPLEVEAEPPPDRELAPATDPQEVVDQ